MPYPKFARRLALEEAVWYNRTHVQAVDGRAFLEEK